MIRVTQYRADQAEAILAQARDVGDCAMIVACVQVREAWLLGSKISRAAFNAIDAFTA